MAKTKAVVEQKPPERPTTTDCRTATRFCKLGATNAQLAEALEISVGKLNIWLKKVPAFKFAVREGKEHADAKVAESLYNRAVGCTVVEEKAVVIGGTEMRVVQLKKEIPPDVAAQGKWLMNRQRERWGGAADGAHDKVTLDVVAMLMEYARRYGVESARQVARDHGYPASIIEGQAREIREA